MADLVVAAGATALAHIRQHGLNADDIAAIFGASGAAKWLAIAGLDHAVFSQFMPKRCDKTPVDLFGTSVGAFKLSAAAQKNPDAALKAFTKAYIEQSYAEGIDPKTIQTQTTRILDKSMHGDSAKAIGEILSNKTYRMHIGAVRCHGGLNSNNRTRQGIALTRAALFRNHLRDIAERTVFSDPRSDLHFAARDGYDVRHASLNVDNYLLALRASGAIPVYMPPVRLPEDPAHFYHDGGLLDYHPVPHSFWPETDGLVLYPHFYDHFKLRWFDKFYPWRRAPRHQLDKIVLLAPSRAWVDALPDSKIPSRQDFTKYRDNEAQRFHNWTEVTTRSYALGEQFIDACTSGDIAKLVVPI